MTSIKVPARLGLQAILRISEIIRRAAKNDDGTLTAEGSRYIRHTITAEFGPVMAESVMSEAEIELDHSATRRLDAQSYEHAQKNMVAFLTDLRARGVSAIAVLGVESEGDRFVYRVTNSVRSVDLQMPGVPLGQVRHTEGTEPLGFSRLHVDGSPWL